MIVLLLFAFLAGIVTILSPCILPILPIVLSSSIGGRDTGKTRPFGVVVGFIASFTFFTLFLSSIVQWTGIPGDSLRLFSAVVIAGFGLSLLIPAFQLIMERLFTSLTRFIPQGNTRTGFMGGVIVGLSLGLLWTPCVGPILASVISLAITGTVTLDAFLITFAYSLGTAIPLFTIMLGGQSVLRKVPWLLTNAGTIQKLFGIVMIVTALGIVFNADRKFQTFILNAFPTYGTGLTAFENNTAVQQQLSLVGDSTVGKGQPTFDLQPKGIKAPEIIPGGAWFNSQPLTLAQLKGKVVLVDFWTYSCINCIRTLPYIRTWWEKYKDKGLVVIGVHSPEFEFEKNEQNVAKAISDFGLTYPIVQDNNFATWRAYDNHYWPAKYFIDKDGYIRSSHFGEGEYDESEQLLQELLEEAGAKDVKSTVHNPEYSVYSQTPETYLGYGRLQGFASPEQIAPDTLAPYTSPATLTENTVAYKGQWYVMKEYANPQKGASLLLNFASKEVYLVMRSKEKESKVEVYVDDTLAYFGEDSKEGTITVTTDRLYKLIRLPSPGRHLLRIEFEDNNTEVYAFTFG